MPEDPAGSPQAHPPAQSQVAQQPPPLSSTPSTLSSSLPITEQRQWSHDPLHTSTSSGDNKETASYTSNPSSSIMAPPRFAPPQPVEMSVKRSRGRREAEDAELDGDSTAVEKKKKQQQSEDEDKALSPKPPFAPPQPVEMSSKSSRRRRKPEADSSADETSTSTSMSSSTTSSSAAVTGAGVTPAPGAVRSAFLPMPVETSTKSNRRKKLGGEHDREETAAASAPTLSESQAASATAAERPTSDKSNSAKDDQQRPPPAPRKKFTPQLIETIPRRSRKKGDTAPCVKATDKTEFSPGDVHHVPREQSRPKVTTPASLLSSSLSEPSERRSEGHGVSNSSGSTPSAGGNHTFHSLSIDGPGNVRQHSWMPPALEPIESSGSEPEEEAKVPSLSTSPSAASTELSDAHRMASRRETCDDRFSGYLLSLAAKAAEKQLRDQAMAAFPNDDHHEPVDHFAVDRDDSVDDNMESERIAGGMSVEYSSAGARRESDAAWQLAEMRDHQAAATARRQQQQQQKGTLKVEGDRLPPPNPSALPGGSSADAQGHPKQIIGGWQKDVGLEQMRNAASPPMLGRDLVFQSFLSPQPTKIETDQYPNAKGFEQCKQGGGLWNGFCIASTNKAAPAHRPPQGLVTPAPERNEDFVLHDEPTSVFATTTTTLAPPSSHLPPSPRELESRLHRTTRGLHETLSPPDPDLSIEDEFSDLFVTQVFNYLSLGYPSLARKFDSELSRITGIPLSELCSNDHVPGPDGTVTRGASFKGLGYVGLGEGNGVGQEQAPGIGRWRALKAYIFEWARQHPGMGAGFVGTDAWGVRARRGSWAL